MQISIDGYENEIGQKLFNGVLAVYAGAVRGHIAEFGTMSGKTAEVLAFGVAHGEKLFHSHNVLSQTIGKELHLFDSFEGLPKIDNAADVDSPHVRDGVWGSGSCKGVSPEALREITERHLSPGGRIKIFEGWYSETVPALDKNTLYALIHVDCDLYSSAMDVLDNLFSRHMIARGAYVFFDDYNCNCADPKFGERRAWAECVDKFHIKFSDEGSYGLLSHKFIVHDYT
ncbi:MAG: class I SAM-dependent methyltransferase [Alphaproteobacteria bacterium]|nr:class I SAM-dependent methyltransferase [Alphaproteobacteria bacterium]